jgi:hypothetical protein
LQILDDLGGHFLREGIFLLFCFFTWLGERDGYDRSYIFFLNT